MTSEEQEHRRQIDARIREGIDRLMRIGEILETDFIPNDAGDKMIAINDEEGVEIIYNYTKATIYKYGDRFND
jgi:hypothetical protein